MKFSRFSPDLIAKYVWITLIIVMIAAIFIVVVLPNTETRSTCRGFQYFVFLDQKMTSGRYQIEILNGPRDITIKDWSVNGIKMSDSADAKAGDSFILSSSSDPTDKNPGEVFSYQFSIYYDIKNGVTENSDIATCTGKVQ